MENIIMSVICGIYYYDGRQIAPETGAAMMRELSFYHTDASGIWREGQVFLGCHAQYITPESEREVIPYYNVQAGLAITADAIIDNREELFNKLSIDSCRDIMPDILLILQAYQRWGKECPKYLVGDFSFAIWDKNRQELFCAVDHTGTRAFYYYLSEGLFSFSTLIKPLFVLPEIDKKYNDTWIADFLAIPSVMHQLDPESTLYRNIYLLPAGHSLTVQPVSAKKQTYWQVGQQIELKLKSDSEYEEAFREVLGEAVRCRLRSTRPVAVMMSGGLDSTTVACIAARELAQRGQLLHAFSAVPMPGYRDWLPAFMIADETPYIEAVRKYTGNMDVTYCRSEGKHSFSDTDRLLEMLEQPYKIIENLFWLDDIMADAQKRNIGIMLNASAGNATISWGDFPTYLVTLYKSGQWLRFLHQGLIFARRYHLSLGKLFKFISSLMLYNTRKKFTPGKKNDFYNSLLDLSPINPEFARCSEVQERFSRFGFELLLNNRLNYSEMRKRKLSLRFFSHLGVITTKHALAYNMFLRDPTMDKRVIEFCFSVPEHQYVRNGRDRYLLRRAMSGILPDKVRLNETRRGKQSADWVQRLLPYWPELATEIRNIGLREHEREYLDVAKISAVLNKYHNLNDNAADDPGLCMLLRSLLFTRFLKHNKFF